MSAEMPARPFKTRESVVRDTLKRQLPSASMVVHVIDQDHIFVFEPKSEPPIFIKPDGPMVRELALQGVQFPARSIHIRRGFCAIERK